MSRHDDAARLEHMLDQAIEGTGRSSEADQVGGPKEPSPEQCSFQWSTFVSLCSNGATAQRADGCSHG